MKRLVLALAVTVAMPAAAIAAPYGTAGCGLGAMVFQDQPGMIQIVAMTLNGIAGNQIFAITTGTLNCTEEGGATAAIDQEVFLRTNYASVMQDAAKGEGEYLATFATLLGCDATAQSEFFGVAQSNYDKIFAGSSDEALVSMKNVARSNANLQASCQRI